MGNNELYEYPIDFRIVGINIIPGDVRVVFIENFMIEIFYCSFPILG